LPLLHPKSLHLVGGALPPLDILRLPPELR
jgi:hypothetical protein